MNAILKDEFEFYLKNQKKLANEYSGKFIVIKGRKVIGVYDSEIKAVEETSKKEPIGTFLVQKCEHGDESITQTFHSRMYYSKS